MAARRSKSSPPLLPSSVSDFFAARLRDGVALTLLAAAVLFVLSLVSFNANDPSWNTAATTLPQNWVGLWGAYVADASLQMIGLASIMVVMALLGWAFRLLTDHRIEAAGYRLVCLVFAVVFASILMAAIPMPQQWPLGSGLGGVMGDVLYQQLMGITWLPTVWWKIVSLSVVGLMFVLALIPSTALSPVQWAKMLIALNMIAWYAVSSVVALVAWIWRSIRFGVQEMGRLFGVLPQMDVEYLSLSEMFRRNRDDRYDDDEGVSDDDVDDASTDGRREPKLFQRDKARRMQPVESDDDDTDADEAEVMVEAKARKKKMPQQKTFAFTQAATSDYELPDIDLLKEPPANSETMHAPDAFKQNAQLLESVLQDFGIQGRIVKVRPGPVVTLYELEPAAGVKTARVIALADDIARSMSAVSVRVALIPGRNVIGIELPNRKREMVLLRAVMESPDYQQSTHNLPIILGKDIGGAPIIADLSRMPHLLIAGTTGSGKSVGINTMILSLLYRHTPDDCRLILVDPKMLELSSYENIPHLLCPVVTDPKKAVVALKWAVKEMESRYRAMSKLGVRNIDGYNQRIRDAKKTGEVLRRRVQTGFDSESGKPVFEDQPIELKLLPMIVIVVDEMADLMLVAGKDIEAAIQRLAQMARAAGIHLIMATQRPSVDVITGTIKANFPTRISFQVTSKIDSRTILGESGAEALLGQGDMLYMAGGGRITRVHGPYVSDEEVASVVKFWQAQGEPQFDDTVTVDDEAEEGDGMLAGDGEAANDELYHEAVEIVRREQKASTSFVQRRLQIGYNRAARMIEQMEADGIITPPNASGRREVVNG